MFVSLNSLCQQWKHSGRGIPFDYNGIEFSSINSSPESKPHGSCGMCPSEAQMKQCA